MLFDGESYAKDNIRTIEISKTTTAKSMFPEQQQQNPCSLERVQSYVSQNCWLNDIFHHTIEFFRKPYLYIKDLISPQEFVDNILCIISSCYNVLLQKILLTRFLMYNFLFKRCVCALSGRKQAFVQELSEKFLTTGCHRVTHLGLDPLPDADNIAQRTIENLEEEQNKH